MLRHRGSLDNSHKDIYSFTAPCTNPRLFLHWSLSPTAHIRLCVQAEVHYDRDKSWEIHQIKVHPVLDEGFIRGGTNSLTTNTLQLPTVVADTLFLQSTKNLRPCMYDQKVFESISPLQPRVYDRKVCILAPRTAHKKDCSNIRTMSITTFLLLTP